MVKKVGKKNGEKKYRHIRQNLHLSEKECLEIRRRPSDGRTHEFKSAFKHIPSCGMETGMDDCVAVGAAAVAVDRLREQRNREHQSVVTRSGLARRGRCNRVPRTYL